jgi:hypothetical protein
MKRPLAVLVAWLGLALPVAAQTTPASPVAPTSAVPIVVPTPIAVPTLPPTPNPTVRSLIDAATGVVRGMLDRNAQHAANTAHGVVTYYKRFDLQLRIGSNTYRTVHLHQGTEIDPRGATIARGNTIDIHGVGQPDGSLAADVITIDR